MYAQTSKWFYQTLMSVLHTCICQTLMSVKHAWQSKVHLTQYNRKPLNKGKSNKSQSSGITQRDVERQGDGERERGMSIPKLSSPAIWGHITMYVVVMGISMHNEKKRDREEYGK